MLSYYNAKVQLYVTDASFTQPNLRLVKTYRTFVDSQGFRTAIKDHLNLTEGITNDWMKQLLEKNIIDDEIASLITLENVKENRGIILIDYLTKHADFITKFKAFINLWNEMDNCYGRSQKDILEKLIENGRLKNDDNLY